MAAARGWAKVLYVRSPLKAWNCLFPPGVKNAWRVPAKKSAEKPAEKPKPAKQAKKKTPAKKKVPAKVGARAKPSRARPGAAE